jgi:hypothetical protein
VIAVFSHPRATGTKPALITALAICVILMGISLFVPPFIYNDSGAGFLAWRGTLLGAANTIITPDTTDIVRDTGVFLAMWSPGQYVVPGVISLLGVPLGIAMTITVGLSLLISLIGWIWVVRTFAPRTNLALPVVILIGSVHYSTHAFSTYHGGEVLLQAATPWLVLSAYRIPKMGMVPAALLAAGAVFVAFFAKLTGLIVVAAALVAGSLLLFGSSRRMTHGMMGGASGAVAAFVCLYLSFILNGSTDLSTVNWSVPLGTIAYASLAPWAAGISWSAPIELILREFFSLAGVDRDFQLGAMFGVDPSGGVAHAVHVACLVPPTLLMAGLVLFWRPATIAQREFRLFSLWFSGIVTLAFIVLIMRSGGYITAEVRYFRSAGTLLFLCALMSATAAKTPRWAKDTFFFLCAFMVLFGLASFSYHELTTVKGQWLDRMSWTNQNMSNQKIFDADAVNFLRDAFAAEGRNAIFVLPATQLALTLPVNARILAMDFNFAAKSEIENLRYSGRVSGHVFVLLPNTIIDAQDGRLDPGKGQALLYMFRDYARDGWQKESFANTSVFFQ